MPKKKRKTNPSKYKIIKASDINWDEIEELELASSLAPKVGVCYHTLVAWCKYRYANLLPYEDLNGHVAIRKEDLKAYLEKRESSSVRFHGKSLGKGFRVPEIFYSTNWDVVKQNLTIPDIARILKVSIPTVSRWLAIGLPSHKVGQTMRVVYKSELISFLSGQYEVTEGAQKIIDRTRNYRSNGSK